MINKLKIAWKVAKILFFTDAAYVVVRKNRDGTFEIEEQATLLINRVMK